MAETLSYQPETTTETVATDLTPEEQESLEIGEKLQGEQEQLLAGKYKDAAELEKAYIELQKKLGSSDQKAEEDTEQASAEEETPEEPKMSEGASLITSASEEYRDSDGKLSDETLAKFSNMSSQDLVKAYMEVQSNPEFQQGRTQAADLTETEINNVKNSVGGDQAYDNIMKWAGQNLTEQEIQAFDDVVEFGGAQAVQLAVSGLKSRYEQANGFEGKMYTGKPPKTGGDVFRSQQELVRAMSDPRYENDPAYRQDIIEKLDRSDLEF
jgi:HD-GYP domain-containing protein (c-di-GMP phosphodiesterase class II)